MKPILVVLTGGTIGSSMENGKIGLRGGTARILELYRHTYGNDCFETVCPITLLSENMTPYDWARLYGCLRDVHTERYAGLIVCHGSDTLPYTAALLGFLFRHLPIPLILVASNRPLGTEGSNGLSNFAAAVRLIRREALPGVYVSYENTPGDMRLYLSTRLLEADPYHDRFMSYGGIDLARITEQGLLPFASSCNPSLSQLRQPRPPIDCPVLDPEKPIALIRPYPGLDYRQFRWAVKPCAILHTDYHSDTASTAPGPYGLPGFVARCTEEGIPVYLCSLRQSHRALYETTLQLLQIGVRPLFSLSTEAALAKLRVAYNQTAMPPEEYLKTDIYYELAEKSSENA